MVPGEAQALAQEGDQQEPVRSGRGLVLLTQGGEGPLGGLLPVAFGPAVVGGVFGVAYGGADQAVKVEGPQAEGDLADEGPLGQPLGGAFLGEAGGPGGEGDVEGVQQAHRAKDVPFVGGEVGQGAGDQGGEVVVEVGRLRGAAAAAQLEEPGDGQIEVQGQAVRAGGDDLPDVLADQGLAVAGEAPGEVVVAVLGGEVADQHLPYRAGVGRGGTGCRHGGVGESGPGGGAGVVELALQRWLGPLQAGAPRDHPEGVRQKPHRPLDQPLQVAAGAVADVLERVQQDDRHHLLALGEAGELPRQQVRIEGQGVQVGFGLQQVRQPGTARQGPYGLAAFAQRADEGAGDLADDRADRAGQHERLSDVGERGLHLLRQRLPEPGAQPGAAQVLLQRFAGVVGLSVAAQRQIEGGQRAPDPGEGGPDRQHDLLEVGAGGAGEVDTYGQDPVRRPARRAPLGGPASGVGERRLQRPGQGRLADTTHAMEDEHVPSGHLEVLGVEAGGTDVLEVLGERSRDRLPLRLPVRERLRGLHAAVVRAEQCPEIPAACHIHPRKMITRTSTYARPAGFGEPAPLPCPRERRIQACPHLGAPWRHRTPGRRPGGQ